METFGEVIQFFRNKKDITLRKFAEMLEVSPAFISMMENNRNLGTAKEETIKKIADILELDPQKLLDLAMKTPQEKLEQNRENALKFFRRKI